jgi:hypothetical protein
MALQFLELCLELYGRAVWVVDYSEVMTMAKPGERPILHFLTLDKYGTFLLIPNNEFTFHLNFNTADSIR